MVVPMYRIRERHGVEFDPNVVYAGVRTLFSIRIHHGGSFTSSPGRSYINGQTHIVDELDSDEFSVHEIDSIVEELGNDGHKVMFYHFLKPDSDLDYGLQPLGSDQDVLFMAKYVEEGHKLIDEVEIEEDVEVLNNDYFESDSDEENELELEDDEPRQYRAGSTKVSRKMVVDVNVGQSSESAKDAGQISGGAKDACQSKSQDPKFDPFTDLDAILPTNTSHQAETNVGDKNDLVSEHSQGHGDGTEHRDDTEHSEGNEHSEWNEDTDSSDDDSQDSDYIMDEENYVDDVDVDMEDFHYNIDESVEFMGSKNRDETFDEVEIEEDVEVLNNDYFESDSDEENELDRLRKRKLKQIRKQAHASPQVYNTYFYVGQDFPNRDAVKELVKEHSIETRREIRMEKNDKERVRVICKGVIPSLPTSEPNGSANGPASPSKVKWTKSKIAEASGCPSPSKQKMTKERIINGGKPKSKKEADGNKCPWVLLVSKPEH
ncbi:mutator type transposase [Tanacetum coccineum]